MKYVNSFRDRHGALRFYFRRFGRRAPLPCPDDPAFATAYERLLQATQPDEVRRLRPYVRQRREAGIIYVVGIREIVKIGFTRDFKKRLRHLQCGCPAALDVFLVRPGTVVEERALHRRFSLYRTRSRSEWYRTTPEVIDWLEKEQMVNTDWQTHAAGLPISPKTLAFSEPKFGHGAP
jgi:hypothetical protein